MTIATAAPEGVGRRSRLERHSLAISVVLWVVGLALTVAGLVLLDRNRATLAAHPEIFIYPLQVTSGLPYLIVGGLIFARRTRNSLGWIVGLAGLSGLFAYFVRQYSIYAVLTAPGTVPLGDAAAWLYNVTWALVIDFYPLFILLYPTGRPPSRGWRWLVWVDCAIMVSMVVPFAIAGWGLHGYDALAESAAPAWLIEYFGLAFAPLFLAGVVASLAAAVVRYRRAPSTERAQIRWLLYAVVCLLLYNLLSNTLLAGTILGNDPTALIAGPSISFLLLPVAIGVAIFRYHLFDIDRLINRTIVYGLLTVILAGIYFGGVTLIQVLLRPLTGAGHDLAVVATTLLIAALFLPIRARVQGGIDRRFYRRKYDAARTLAAFSAHVRDEVALDRLAGRLVEVVDETMQPAHVSLWLREPRGVVSPTPRSKI